MTEERIGRAAIKYKGGSGDPIVWAVPQPGRHHDVIKSMAASGLGPDAMHDQGFRTSTGRFVDRVEGLAIAKAAGQVVEKHGNPNELYSEDMW